MKKLLLCLLVLSGWLACAILYLNRQKTPPAPAPVVESSPAPVEAAPNESSAPRPQLPPAIPASAAAPVKVPAVTPVVSETKPDDAAAAVRKGVDALLSAKTAEQKQAVFRILFKMAMGSEIQTLRGDLAKLPEGALEEILAFAGERIQ